MSTELHGTHETDNAQRVDNVYYLRKSNVINLNPITEESGCIVEIAPLVEVTSLTETDGVEQQSFDDNSKNTPSCMNGVCSISWKPKRPSAA